MKNKSHERSPDKQGFSIALPKRLVARIQDIAKKETRSRNGQIEKFLEDSVARYHSVPKTLEPSPVSSNTIPFEILNQIEPGRAISHNGEIWMTQIGFSARQIVEIEEASLALGLTVRDRAAEYVLGLIGKFPSLPPHPIPCTASAAAFRAVGFSDAQLAHLGGIWKAQGGDQPWSEWWVKQIYAALTQASKQASKSVRQ